jgi:hypothetical protein
MLVHARLPDMYLYHALRYACNVFNILPLKDLVTADGTVTTPFELFVGSKPMVGHFRVFGCPCIAKSGPFQWMASLRRTVMALREELGVYTLDFPQPRKDCYSMSHLLDRLSFLVM